MTTAAEALPASLTVRYIVDTAGKEETRQAVEDPKKFLKDNGVNVTSEDSDKDIQKAVSVAQDSSFWQKHASLHPQRSRSKNWLWVHDRYRTQADALLTLKDDPSKQKAAFEKFHNKIESHSEFEDTQLFKFFLDAKIGDQETLEELKKQHGHVRVVREITEGLEKCASGSASEDETKAAQAKLEAYVNDLKAHLDLEEKTVTGPWMQLTPEQYRTYRTYLSWTYCFMY